MLCSVLLYGFTIIYLTVFLFYWTWGNFSFAVKINASVIDEVMSFCMCASVCGVILRRGIAASGVYTFCILDQFSSVQFSSTPGPVHHKLLEFTQTHVHWVCDAVQPSHPLLSPSPPAPNPSQYQDLFQWVNSSHQVAKVLEFQLQHQSFQWTPRTDLL